MSAEHVLLALESSGAGGAERVVLQLAAGLRAAGHRVSLLTTRPGWLVERAAQLGLPCWVRPQARGVAPGWVPRLAAELRRHDVQLVHSHEFAMNVYAGAAARLVGVPTLATLHGHRWIGERRVRPLAYGLLWRAGMAINAVSRELADHLAGVLPVPREAIRTVRNGTALPPSPGSRSAVERRLHRDLAGSGPLLLAVGNLLAVKDHATAVRALPRVPGATLAIAGRGPESTPLLRLAEQLGVSRRLRLLGHRDDVPTLLRAADLVVHPSRREGLPMAILEAMALQRPVVATQVGGIPEAIEDGVSGRLVPPGDADALAAALCALLADPGQQLRIGAAARARVEQEFSVDAMVDRYGRLYAELAAREARGWRARLASRLSRRRDQGAPAPAPAPARRADLPGSCPGPSGTPRSSPPPRDRH